MSKDDDSPVSALSCWITASVFLLGLSFLGVRLREVQVSGAAGYTYASSCQSVRRVQTAGTRGRILDRAGRPLAENRASLSIVCNAAMFQKKTWEETVSAISNAIAAVGRVVGRPCPLGARTIRRHVNQTLAMPLFVWRDIDSIMLARFSEHESSFPGFGCIETWERSYPAGETAAHILGYVGRDRGDGAEGDERYNFYLPEMRGRSGLELYYDSFLRGVPGEVLLTVDARGFALRGETVAEPGTGPDLVLSIDLEIQRAVERELKGERGACVVMDPRNGEVLAMASAPGFDPNAFVPTLSRELYGRYAADPGKPLLNRASGGAYAPGSTFKPVTALAGLRAGHSDCATYDCCGVFFFGTMQLRCASRWGHGSIDMRHALMKSCNPYFCQLGVEIGTNALIAAAHDLGLGRKTGLDLGVDMAGTIPDGAWKQKMYHERWYPGDLPQMSIGQGMVLASPLQMARVAGAVGSGYLVTPHLKKDVPAQRHLIPFSAKALRVVREGLRMVVAGDGESRGGGHLGGERVAVPVSGKTGTAEVGSGANRRKNTWFIAYAPSESPRACLAMVIENGESGGGTTAPKAGAVMRAIFGEVAN